MATSPIESRLHRAILSAAADRDMHIADFDPGRVDVEVRECDGGASFFSRRDIYGLCDYDEIAGSAESQRHLFVARNALACGYRIDIVVCFYDYAARAYEHAKSQNTLLLVECDGFDWHERTVQQATRDRARDREILRKLGVPVVRFTGSEIVRDTEACAIEVLELAVSAWTKASDKASAEAQHAVSWYQHMQEAE